MGNFIDKGQIFIFDKKFVGENKNGLRFSGTIYDKYGYRKGRVLNGVIFKWNTHS